VPVPAYVSIRSFKVAIDGYEIEYAQLSHVNLLKISASRCRQKRF
jgi:hypothetical protein